MISSLKNQGGIDWRKYNVTPYAYFSGSNYSHPVGNLELISITGEGILTNLFFENETSTIELIMVVDGVEKNLHAQNTQGAKNYQSSAPIAFENSLVLKSNNRTTGTQITTFTLQALVHLPK